MGVSAGQDLEPSTNPTHRSEDRSRTRNTGFAISVESLSRKLKQNKDITIVDVRRRDRFEKFRISGSINIPLFAVKTKTFLKNKPMVLVNEGFNCGDLELACRQLRGAGFDVRILNGGLNHWWEKGMPLKGDVFAREMLNRIPPRRPVCRKGLRSLAPD